MVDLLLENKHLLGHMLSCHSNVSLKFFASFNFSVESFRLRCRLVLQGTIQSQLNPREDANKLKEVLDQRFLQICMEWMVTYNRGEESALSIKDKATTSGKWWKIMITFNMAELNCKVQKVVAALFLSGMGYHLCVKMTYASNRVSNRNVFGCFFFPRKFPKVLDLNSGENHQTIPIKQTQSTEKWDLSIFILS